MLPPTDWDGCNTVPDTATRLPGRCSVRPQWRTVGIRDMLEILRPPRGAAATGLGADGVPLLLSSATPNRCQASSHEGTHNPNEHRWSRLCRASTSHHHFRAPGLSDSYTPREVPGICRCLATMSPTRSDLTGDSRKPPFWSLESSAGANLSPWRHLFGRHPPVNR